MSDIVIQRTPSGTVYPGQTVNFTIVSGVSSCLYASFEWYLNDEIVSTDNNLSLVLPEIGGYSVYVKVNEFCQVFWHNGHFYGGSFNGNFSGGTFYYGYLNKTYYDQQTKKPKPFVENIQSSIKSSNSSTLQVPKSSDISYNNSNYHSRLSHRHRRD